MKFFLLILLILPCTSIGQNVQLENLINNEFELGRFNGSVLFVENGQATKIHKGYANFQFKVEINEDTKFPIASISKLFTTIAILQLQEKCLLSLDDEIIMFIPSLSKDLKNITIKDLLIHNSGLKNEPIAAVTSKYSIDEYLANFVKKSANNNKEFNYNNVDYVILSKIIETITNKSISKSIEQLILKPIQLNNTGFVSESEINNNLAYGYHNYTFGEGDLNDPLFNDQIYISNYYGGGGMYSTTEDLLILLKAIKNNRLISKKYKKQYLFKKQSDVYIKWLFGTPTFGFYFNEEKCVFKRSGSIGGFNSEIIVNDSLDKILIVLCNTDTADLHNLSNKIYFHSELN